MPPPHSECQAALKIIDAKLDQLRQIAAEFPEEQLWQRPRDGIVSLGNLLCHVAGSMRDWFENGIGQGSWQRDRAAEFQREDGLDRRELIEQLDQTRQHCQTILDTIDADTWTASRTFRDKTFTVRDILLRQLDHVAYHAGQAAFLRWLTGGLEPKSLTDFPLSGKRG